jgi:protein-L-isoaspartate(D-aspartate) O-methyltransferase
MENFDSLRQRMVEEQLVARGIGDGRVLAAFRRVPRERFVPREFRHLSYVDAPLGIGEGQTISQPYTVARMTELLELKPTDKVLEVGTGSGYQAAILAEIVTPRHARGDLERSREVKEGKVFTLELLAILARKAAAVISDLGYRNVEVIVGDGSQGLSSEAPFDAIIVTAAAPEVPRPLVDQLAVGGRLVLPVGRGRLQEMIRITKREDGTVGEEELGAYRFVPLKGKHGFDRDAR